MDRFGRLVEITEIAYAAKQKSLAKLMGIERDLQTDLAELDRRLATQNFDTFSNPQDIRADINWKSWCEKERRRLNVLLAQVRAERLEMRNEVSRLFGRYLAAQKIVEKVAKS